MKIIFILLVSISFLLPGCGGGGGGDGGTNTQTPRPISTVSVSGVAIDGNLYKATVFLDLNGDGLLTTGEPTATTDEFGRFTLLATQDQIDKYKVVVLAIAGTTIDQDNPNTAITAGFTLLAPAGNSSVVSPLTTQVVARMDTGATLENAKSAVQAELGLTAVDVMKNYVALKGTDTNYAKAHNIAASLAEVLKTIEADASSNTKLSDKLASLSSKVTAQVAPNIDAIKSATSISNALRIANIPKTPQSISITSVLQVLKDGASSVLSAVITFTDKTTQNISALADWAITKVSGDANGTVTKKSDDTNLKATNSGYLDIVANYLGKASDALRIQITCDAGSPSSNPFSSCALATSPVSGSGQQSPPTAVETPTQTITGIVSAPGGTVAFNTPKFILRIFDVLFGETAQAAQTNLAAVAGVKVNLIEIDDAGAQVGTPIATATTALDGTYSLKVSQNFVPSGKYVIRVVGSGSNQMSAFVTSNVANVSPISDALYGLVLTSAGANDGKVTGLATSTISDLNDIVEELITSSEVELTGVTAKAISDALKDAASIDEESDSRLKHAFGKGKISGIVTALSGTGSAGSGSSGSGPSGKGCAGVTILIRDFGNIVTQYSTKTGPDGKWSVTVQHTGNYIIGAMNDGKDCTDGSQWWASPNLVTKQLSAEKVTGVANQTVTRDFQLPAGGRIQGIVKAGNSGLPLAGITIKVRDFLNTQMVAFTKTKEDGSYVINLAPGSYFLTAENKTKKPYATETYSPSRSGGTSFFDADKLTVVAGTTQTANFSLQAGRMVSGLVSDPVAGPIAGMRVRFDDADDTEHADVHRTNKKGQYRIWLRPDTYLMLSRGQRKLVDLTSANQIADFSEAVGEVRMLIQDTAGNPISQAKPRFRARTAIGTDLTKFDVLSKEASNGDGTVSLYATNANKDNNWLEIKIDNGTATGSSIYSGKNRLQDGDAIPITIGSVNDLGAITLPAGGVLSGKVTVAGVPQGGVRVQVRNVGTTVNNGGKGSGDRFTTTRTMSDGTYSLSLPVGTITRVCAFTGNQASNCPSSGTGTGKGSGNSFSYEFIDNVVITANANNPKDFSLPAPVQ